MVRSSFAARRYCGNFFEGGPLSNGDVMLRALKAELGTGMSTSRRLRIIAQLGVYRGLRIVTQLGVYPDFRLSFADLVLSRIDTKSALRETVIEALGYLEQMIGDGVYDKMRQLSRSLFALSNERQENERDEYAEVVRKAAARLVKMAEVFRSKSIYLIVKLSGHVSMACDDDEMALRRSYGERAISNFNLFIAQGFVTGPRLLAELCTSMLAAVGLQTASAEVCEKYMSLYLETAKGACTLEHVEQLIELGQELSRTLGFSSHDQFVESLGRNSASDILRQAEERG
jgi:hypothetical protein